MRRASLSILSNIAEGFESMTVPEFIQFLGYAKRSVGEVRSHLYDALDDQYITKDKFFKHSKQSKRIGSMIAKLIHYSGSKKTEPFITINCAAVPHTLWEVELFGHIKGSFTDAKANRKGSITASGKGTLFLDEIGEMPYDVQSKLLRVLQENKYRAVGSSDKKNPG